MLTPFNAPQLPVQWYENNYLANINGDKIGQALGITWLRNSRLSPLYHMSFLSFLQTLFFMARNKHKINEKLKMFGEQKDLYGRFDITK